MTVHRALAEHVTQPARIPLGRIQVTIDDLAALLTMLHKKLPAEEVRVEFLGGSFDDPADLKILSDAELEQLNIKTDSIQVVLSRTDALAIGDENIGIAIRDQWARSRVTRERPTRHSRLRNLTDAGLVVMLLFLIIVLALKSAGLNLPDWIYPSGFPISAAWLVTPIGVVLCVSMLSSGRWPLHSYAVIKPYTLEEARAALITTRRYSITTTIAITSIVVAAATTLVVKVLT